MKLIIPPIQSQLSTFLNSFDLIDRFYNLFVVARNLQQLQPVNSKFSPLSGTVLTFKINSQSYWIEIIPAGTIATLTIIFPDVGGLIDGQEIILTTTQAISALTLTAIGTSFNIPVTTLAANASVRFKYSKSSNVWYKL